MINKLKAVAIALCIGGTTFAFVPSAYANNAQSERRIVQFHDTTGGHASAPLNVILDQGRVIMYWETPFWEGRPEYEGGYLIERDSGDGFKTIYEYSAGRDSHVDEPGKGTHLYRVKWYFHDDRQGVTFFSGPRKAMAVAL